MRLRRIYPICTPHLAPGFLNPASGGKTTLQVHLNPYWLALEQSQWGQLVRSTSSSAFRTSSNNAGAAVAASLAETLGYPILIAPGTI